MLKILTASRSPLAHVLLFDLLRISDGNITIHPFRMAGNKQ